MGDYVQNELEGAVVACAVAVTSQPCYPGCIATEPHLGFKAEGPNKADENSWSTKFGTHLIMRWSWYRESRQEKEYLQ